jgi:hypothetical protein
MSVVNLEFRCRENAVYRRQDPYPKDTATSAASRRRDQGVERSIEFVELDSARAISASDGEISTPEAELSLEPEAFVGECARQYSLPSTADSGQRFQPGPRRRHRDGILSFFNPPPSTRALKTRLGMISSDLYCYNIL